MKLRNFYLRQYPTDDLGVDIIKDTTFLGLLDCLHRGIDVYFYIGVYDSIVRERLFSKLASLMGVNYDFVYDLWLNR